MALSQTTVLRLYNTVMEDVIAGVRETFLDDGVDETVLQELRQLWESKLMASKAVEQNPEPPEHIPPAIVANSLKANGNKSGSKKASNAADQHLINQAMNQMHSSNTSNNNANSMPTQVASNNQNTVNNLVSLDPNNKVPVQLTLPAQAGVPGSQPRVFTLQIPTSALQNNQLHQVLTGPIITATMNLPQPLAATLLQQHINAALSGQQSSFNTVTTNASNLHKSQVDGACDSSDDEISDGGGSDDDVEGEGDGEAEGSGGGSDGGVGDEGDEDGEGEGGAEEEPLNSGDDVSEEDPSDMFDTDNVVVCQYDKITRSRNKWKFYLKDGIMNLSGKDYVFQKANGDAEW